jgi:hypothetical protein
MRLGQIQYFALAAILPRADRDAWFPEPSLAPEAPEPDPAADQIRELFRLIDASER